MPDLTPAQEKAVIEAFTALYGGWVDAWDNASPEEQSIAVALFLAGVKWAEAAATQAEAPQQPPEQQEPPQREGI